MSQTLKTSLLVRVTRNICVTHRSAGFSSTFICAAHRTGQYQLISWRTYHDIKPILHQSKAVTVRRSTSDNQPHPTTPSSAHHSSPAVTSTASSSFSRSLGGLAFDPECIGYALAATGIASRAAEAVRCVRATRPRPLTSWAARLSLTTQG